MEIALDHTRNIRRGLANRASFYRSSLSMIGERKMKSRTLKHFLHHRLMLLLIPLTAFLLAGTPAIAAPTLVVNGGILEGATGVDVGGTLYDVTFMDGSCADVFDGCDESADFPFPNTVTTQSAWAALLPTIQSSPFVNLPNNILGCGPGETVCRIRTPTAVILGPPAAFFHASITLRSGSAPTTETGSTLITVDFGSQGTLGKWTVSPEPVPEPTTMMLLSTGLLGLVGYRWRQGRREGQHIG